MVFSCIRVAETGWVLFSQQGKAWEVADHLSQLAGLVSGEAVRPWALLKALQWLRMWEWLAVIPPLWPLLFPGLFLAGG